MSDERDELRALVGQFRTHLAMRGRSGVLHTGHCLVQPAGGVEVARPVATTVHFAEVTDEEIAAYVASGECIGKAGAYAIQGRAAAFVPHIAGSYSSVMGLPLFETLELLRAFGIGPA